MTNYKTIAYTSCKVINVDTKRASIINTYEEPKIINKNCVNI